MLSPEQVVDTYFLEARHMLLEIAALLDRYDAAVGRGETSAGNGRPTAAAAKLAVLREALGILHADGPQRERTVALLELFARV
jgi:hypothetical protein